jgi:hypothetical protein
VRRSDFIEKELSRYLAASKNPESDPSFPKGWEKRKSQSFGSFSDIGNRFGAKAFFAMKGKGFFRFLLNPGPGYLGDPEGENCSPGECAFSAD